MRLKNYITEVTKMANELKDIKKDFKEWFDIIAKVFDKRGWNMSDKDMLDALNAITKPQGVEWKIWKRRSSGKYLSGARFGGEGVERGIYFTVYVNPGFTEYFKRFEKPNRRKMLFDINQNAFLRELFDILAHETTHAMQLFAINDFGNPDAYADQMERQGEQDVVHKKLEYYSDPREIEAYALQAAIEYARLNQSRIIDIYHQYFKEDNPKVWKAFLKKYAFYKDEIKKSGLIFALAKLKNKRERK